MFATLTFLKSKKRLCKNIRIEEKHIGDIEYLNVVCFKKINPKKIEKKLKNKVDTIILAENIDNIEFKNIKVYNSDKYLKIISIYTFKNIIRLSNIPLNKLSVCLIDKKGLFADFAYSLANSASIIKIVTDKPEFFIEIKNKIYDDFGMEPIITNEMSDADLGLDLSDTIPKIWFKTPKNFVTIDKSCVTLGAGLKKYVPKGINQCDFAGVLQKYKDFRRLKLLNAQVMIKNNGIYKINRDNIKNFLDN